MPSFYTHYNFGKNIIPKLSPNIQDIIKQNEELFVFGNQGPDLFFFHLASALKGTNPGIGMHDESFKTLVDEANYNILKLGVHSPSNAYFFGLCCHFLLDTMLHPTVDAITTKDYTHFDIESELDRFYIRQNGEDENKLLQSKLLPRPEIAEYIYPIYAHNPDVSKELIYQSIRNMRLIKSIFQSKGPKKEAMLLGILKILRLSVFSGQLIRQIPFEASINSNEKLDKLYKDAVERAPQYLDEVYSYVFEGGEAPEEFRKDFNGV